jgi:hypothetical protein
MMNCEAMSRTVRLSEIIGALEMQFEESSSFLDLDRGEVETVSHSLLSKAEDSVEEDPDLPAWQKEEWETAKRIALTDRFIKLPTAFDVHEWAIMQEFALSVASDAVRNDLLDAIHGGGAFRNFKAAIRRRGVEEAWFEFRAEALRQIAIDWCKENGVAWE